MKITIHTHTHPFDGPLSGTTRVSRYQKGRSNLDFTGARDSGWQWHQLGHMQVCTSLQTDNHASTPPLSFYRPDALSAAQPTASKHWKQLYQLHRRRPPTHSFTPGLKPSFSANPSHCSPSFLLLKYLLHGFPGLFTVISEHICFLLLVFFCFYTF